ncbi:hypothetical protein Efla_001880 [Eimeria flavescens]
MMVMAVALPGEQPHWQGAQEGFRLRGSQPFSEDAPECHRALPFQSSPAVTETGRLPARQVVQKLGSPPRAWASKDRLRPHNVGVPPLARALQAEGCTRDVLPPGRRAAPLPLCVRCSRPTGESREL